MIDDGIFFSYENDRAYAKSIQSIRDRLCAHNGNYYTLVDRQRRTMRRFAISIFDENNDSAIDVCLLGNTLYILAMRLAEMKWFKTCKQPVEFSGCDGSIAMELPFEGGYGELGISGSSGHPRFTRDQASMHTAAMKDYMLAAASGVVSPAQELRCKVAFAYFAMTIAEAARFHSVEIMMYRGGIDPVSVIPALRRWVIDSSVRDDQFPSHNIAIAGIHEQRSGKVWKDIVENLRANAQLSPTDDDLYGSSVGTREFLSKQGVFAKTDVQSSSAKKRGEKSGYDSGYEFLLDAYFRSRSRAGILDEARLKFDELSRLGREVSASALAGLNIV